MPIALKYLIAHRRDYSFIVFGNVNQNTLPAIYNTRIPRERDAP